MASTSLSDDELQKLFAWVDTIPLSRPKRNISRDFSDAVLAAEVVAFYFPRIIEMHNYTGTSSSTLKLSNWNTLHKKVLKPKLKFHLPPPIIEDLVHAKPGAIETFLHTLQYKLAKYKAEKGTGTTPAKTTAAPAAGALGGGESSGSGDETARRPLSLSPLPPSSLAPVLSPGRSRTNAPPSPVPSSGMSVMSGASCPSPTFTSTISGMKHTQGHTHTHTQLSPRQQQQQAQSQAHHQGIPTPTTNTTSPRHQAGLHREVDEEILLEKEETIQELRETVEILEMKMVKLEQLVRLKDSKIQQLSHEVARLTIGEEEERDGCVSGSEGGRM